MRRDLINDLEDLYVCINEGSYINQIVDNFSEQLNNVLWDYRTQTNKTSHAEIKGEDKPWFNKDCRVLYNRYLSDLEEYNKLHNTISYARLSKSKAVYKNYRKDLKINTGDSKAIW
jgi:hypothetical protein